MAKTEVPRKPAPGFEGVRQFEVMLHVQAVIFIPDEVYVLGAEAVEEAIEGKVSRAMIATPLGIDLSPILPSHSQRTLICRRLCVFPERAEPLNRLIRFRSEITCL